MARARGWVLRGACALAVVTVLGPVTASAAVSEGVGSRRVVVQLEHGVPPDVVIGRLSIHPLGLLPRAIHGFAADVTPAQLAALRRDPSVRRVVVDAATSVVPEVSRRAVRLADDPRQLERSLSPLQRIVQAVAHLAGVGDPAQEVPTALARVGVRSAPAVRHDGVDDSVPARIALVDTGVERHPDLHVADGTDCIGGGAFTDGYGHGTLVAGVAAAVDNAIDVVGTAPGAAILSAKAVGTNGRGSVESLLCAFEWAMDPRQHTDVINVSLAWGEDDFGANGAPCGTEGADLIHEAICAAVARGITVVAAAGNEHADTSHVYPAAYPEVITVSGLADFDGEPGGRASAAPPCGAGEEDDHLRSVSNYGEPVDVDAVATCVLTTARGGGVVLLHGTSLAAPAVSGAAALVRAADPTATPAIVRQRILAAASPGPIPGDPDEHPEGVLDVSRL